LDQILECVLKAIISFFKLNFTPFFLPKLSPPLISTALTLTPFPFNGSLSSAGFAGRLREGFSLRTPFENLFVVVGYPH